MNFRRDYLQSGTRQGENAAGGMRGMWRPLDSDPLQVALIAFFTVCRSHLARFMPCLRPFPGRLV